MKDKWVSRLMRVLILAAGAGAGAALAFLCVQVHDLTSDEPVALGLLILLYGGMGAMGALCAYLFTPRMLSWWREESAALEKRMDDLSTTQLISMVLWLMGGLLVASLLTQIWRFLGDGIFTMALSAICYVVLGVMGITIGARRADDLGAMLAGGLRGPQEEMLPLRVKVLDGSVLMDGRIAAICRTGIVEGEVITTDYVIAEMQEMADSADAARRARGQKGLETVRQMQSGSCPLRVETTGTPFPLETDVALMSLVRERSAALLTADAAMHKAARVAGIAVVNVNDLACAMRSVTAAGDVLALRITKEGREAGQGVGYLEDGTMVVVENAAHLLGGTVEVVVTSVLQTSAGRMVFARPREQ